MQDKPHDIPYHNVREDLIKSAKPVLNQTVVQHAWNWIRERYQVHVNKDVKKLPAPWTNDPVLRQVKFCNVRREHDRQSLNLIQNIVNAPNLSLQDKMMNSVLFRMFNLWEPLEAMGAPWTINEFANLDLDKARKDLMAFEEKGGKIFTNAFNTGGLKQCLAFPEMVYRCDDKNALKAWVKITDFAGVTRTMKYQEAKIIVSEFPESYTIEGWEPYMPMRVVRSIKEFVNLYPDFFDTILNLDEPVDVYETMLNRIEGLGPFLAYQIWVDFTYNPDYPFSENHFTIAGPGCKAGIDLMFTNTGGMTHEECIFWLRDNQDDVFGSLGYTRDMWSAEKEYDKCMNVMQLENLFCELQKYIRCCEQIKKGDKPRGKVGYDGNGKAKATSTGSVSLLSMLKR